MIFKHNDCNLVNYMNQKLKYLVNKSYSDFSEDKN